MDDFFDDLYFFDDLCQFGNLDGGIWFVHNRNIVQRASKIYWKCWTVEILALRQVVDKVEDHPRPLQKRQAENCVDGDVRTHGNQERCFSPSRGLVEKVELKAHLQIGGDSFMLMGLDDA